MATIDPGKHGAGDRHGLWALLWRIIVFGPLVGVFGMLALIAVLGFTFVLPIWVIAWLCEDRWILAIAGCFAWFGWLKFGGRVRRFVFEGFDNRLR